MRQWNLQNLEGVNMRPEIKYTCFSLSVYDYFMLDDASFNQKSIFTGAMKNHNIMTQFDLYVTYLPNRSRSSRNEFEIENQFIYLFHSDKRC